MDKAWWRRELVARRAALPASERRAYGERMLAHFLSLPELARVGLGPVLLYAAVEPEAPTEPLAAALLARGIRVCLPRLAWGRRGHMDVVPVSGWDRLVPGPFAGIPQPPPDAPAIEAASLTAVVVPGVGFDRRGRRLGYGGGYYDRLLERLSPGAVRIGWAFAVQVVDELPEEPHDQRVHLIVTEAGAVRPGAEPSFEL